METKKLPGSIVEIKGEIEAAEFDKHREEILKNLSRDKKIPGFRPGHAPVSVVEKEIGEETILMRMAEATLNEHYPKILKENKLDAIGRPEITITKIARGNPLGFVITTAVYPEIALPDYKPLAKEITDKPTEDTKVNDEEVTKVVNDLLNNRNNSQEKSGSKAKLDDDFAKQLGAESLTDLNEKVKNGLEKEKRTKIRDKRRLEIIDRIAKDTKVEIPQVMIDSELETMIAEMKHNISQMGIPFEKYLENIKKTEEDLKKEWQEQAKRRVTTGLILTTIAKAEKISVPEKELEDELGHLLKHHPKANPDQARHYLSGLMTNEKVFEFLERV